MKFSELANYLEKLEKTSGRIEMTKILAGLFKEVSLNEIDKICYLLLGRLVPLFESLEFNIAEKTMTRVLSFVFQVNEQQVKNLFKEVGDLGEAAYELSLKFPPKGRAGAVQSSKLKKEISVIQVFEKLCEIAKDFGIGSQERKIKLLGDLLLQLDPVSAKYLVRVPLGKMRLGLADKTLIEALSWMQKGDKTLKEAIEKYYFVYPDIGAIAKKFKKGGVSALQKIELSIGVPILPELCQRVGTAEEIIEKMRNVAVEPKFDGTRIQLHFSRTKQWELLKEAEFDFGEIGKKGFVRAFTRNLEEVTHMFPEIVEAVSSQIDAKEVILDGEAVGFDPKTQKFLPFQVTIQRKRKYQVKEKVSEIPLRYFVFDILYKDGKSLLNKPFSQRRETLQKTLKKGETIFITPQKIIENASELKKSLADATNKGLEGVVIKKVNGIYEPGARGFSWVKFKREEEGGESVSRFGGLVDTIDCVVLGYYAGKGKRTEFGIGAFLVGVYNEDKDNFESISKIGTGLTDEQWRDLKLKISAKGKSASGGKNEKLKIDEKPVRYVVSKELIPDVWIEPRLVAEILADEITRSPVHTAGAKSNEPGYALRFPRLIRWRDDKSVQQATTVKEVKRLYKLQRKV